MQHIVVSRFNVRMHDHPAPTESWARERLGLFERYTVPSMRSQSSVCSRWIIFCDAGSRPWLEPVLAAALGDVPVAEPVWIDGRFWDCARDEISARVEPVGRVITTRIDTDDAVSRGYLEAVQGAAEGVDLGAINFLHGAQLHGTRTYRRSDPSNAFISFVEEASERPLTVFVDQHHLLDRHGPLLQVRTSPMWLQVIHGGNAANAVSGIRTSAARILRDFDLDVVPSETAAEVALDRARTSLRLAGRVLSAPHRLRWAARVLFSRGRRPGAG